MVTVPEGLLVLPWESCTVYEKEPVAIPVCAGIDAVNPPWASTTRVPPEIVGAGEVTTVIGKPLGSEFPIRRPGEAIFR
jgi:hypothetical protein